MIFKRLTIPVLTRVNVSVETVSGTHSLRVRFNT